MLDKMRHKNTFCDRFRQPGNRVKCGNMSKLLYLSGVRKVLDYKHTQKTNGRGNADEAR